MQTKKRAKSVKFGKAIKAPEEKKIVKEQEEEEIKKPKKPEAEEAEIEAESEPEENETKKFIDAQKEAEDEPEEINLSKEPEESEEEIAAEPEEDEEKKEVLSVVESETPAEEPSPFGSFAKAPDESAERRSNTWFFIMVTLVAFVIGLVCIAGIYYFTGTGFEVKPISMPQLIAKPTPTPTLTPSPTPKQLDLSTYVIKVLNGSGVTGEAAKVKSSLTTAGFSVSGTGNADNSDYTKTVIEAKKGTDEAYLKALIASLKKTYAIDSNIQTITSSEDSDVIVIIGSTTVQ